MEEEDYNICPVFCTAAIPLQIIDNLLMRAVEEDTALLILDGETVDDGSKAKRASRAPFSKPIDNPFAESATPYDIYDMWKRKLRGPANSTESNLTSFTFAILDRQTLVDYSCVVCCDAPDFGEQEDEVVLKALRMGFDEALFNLARFEMLTCAPSEARSDMVLSVIPPAIFDTTGFPPGSMKGTLATPAVARQNKRRAIMEAEAQLASEALEQPPVLDASTPPTTSRLDPHRRDVVHREPHILAVRLTPFRGRPSKGEGKGGALLEEGEADREEQRVPTSPATTRDRSVSSGQAVAPLSPTSTVAFSSPELPPLPSLPAFGGLPRTPSSSVARGSSAREHRALASSHADSSYYTASWGSPYKQPSPEFNRRLSAQGALSSDGGEEDSSPNFRFGLEHLIPSRLPGSEFHGPSRPNSSLAIWTPGESLRRFGAELPSSPPRHLRRRSEDDQVHQPLAADHAPGKGEVWSDASTEGEYHSVGNSRATSDAAGSTSSLLSPEAARRGRLRKHRSRESNLTLTPDDFLSFLGPEDRKRVGKMMASKYADAAVAQHIEEKTPKASPTARGFDKRSPPSSPMPKAKNSPKPKSIDSTRSKSIDSPKPKSSTPPESEEAQSARPSDAEFSKPTDMKSPKPETVEPSNSTAAKSSKPEAEDTPKFGTEDSAKLPSPFYVPTEPKPVEPKPTDAPGPSHAPAPSQASAPSPAPVRVRKHIAWRGKRCIISIPSDHTRGQPGGPPLPLSPAEVEARLRNFERAGYNIDGFDDGFDVFAGPHSSVKAQNRVIYPDPDEDQDSMRQRKFGVKVPNQAAWREYVDFLTEQKLRALGVSLGGDEDPSPMEASSQAPSQAPSQARSRQNSSQHPGLPFSPPPPTLSAGSQRPMPQQINGIAASGAVPGFQSGHASTRSVASPSSSFGNPRASVHMHRHSTFTSPSSFSQPTQPTPPGLTSWSPHQYFGPQGTARGGSPAVSANRADVSDIVSPHSPFGPVVNQQSPFTPREEFLAQAQLQVQEQQLQARLMAQQQQQVLQQQQQLMNMRPSSTLEEVPEAENEEDAAAEAKPSISVPAEVVHPRPRSHRHNVSEQFERKIQNAEYHLEQSIDKQLDRGGEFSTDARFGDFRSPRTTDKSMQQVVEENEEADWKNVRGAREDVLHHPQPHSRTHSLTKQEQSEGVVSQFEDDAVKKAIWMADGEKSKLTDVSEQPSPSEEQDLSRVEESPKEATQGKKAKPSLINTISQAVNAPSPMHSSKSSMSSKLNVDAKEFKFNPAASFSPGNFSSGFSFGPASTKPFALPTHTNSQSHASRSSADVSTPSFNASAQTFSPGLMNGGALPTGEFNFMAGGPAFNAAAPTFQPAGDVNNQPNRTSSVPGDEGNKIFSNIDLSDIVKPAKRSKAIPIVKPDAQPAKQSKAIPIVKPDDGFKEGEDGRPIQDDARSKRARRVDDGGDSVPQFAMPSHPLGEKAMFQETTKSAPSDAGAIPSGKENLGPAGDYKRVPETTEGTLAAQSLGPHTDVTSGAATTNNDSENTFPDVDDTTTLEETVSEAPASKRTSKGSLSATAKPFEFKPTGTSSFEIGMHVTKPSTDRHGNDFTEIPLDHERDRSATPTRHVSRSPATTFRPSDDGSFQTAPEMRKQLPYPDSDGVDFSAHVQPTFDEIDAVMKHMDEQGPDFGIEQDHQSWTHSSPPTSRPPFLGYNHPELRPTSHFRSDAPSPSLRGVDQLARDEDNESEVTHDPFSDGRAGREYESPVRQLNNREDGPISDWDDVVSSGEEDKILPRSKFFDTHVNQIINGVLQSRLGPVEKSLQLIQDSVIALSQQRDGRRKARSTSAEIVDSDADDEDEETGTERQQYRNRSPIKDRKLQKIKMMIQEAFANHQPHELPPPAPPIDLSDFYQAVGDIKMSLARSASSNLQLEDIKDVVDDVVKAQNIAQVQNQLEGIKDVVNEVVKSQNMVQVQTQLDGIKEVVDGVVTRQNIALEQNHREEPKPDGPDLRVAELEIKLAEATARAKEEADARVAAEAREAESQRQLKLVDEELGALREGSREDEQRTKALYEEISELRAKTAFAESAQEEVRKKLQGVNVENEALMATLDEYRLSANKWRHDLDQANEENVMLQKAVAELRYQTEEAIRIREMMRDKLDRLQQDMTAAAGQVVDEKARWRKVDEDHRTRYEVLSARIEAEARTRERLERELERLERQEREKMKMKVILEQTQAANAKLEETVQQLRAECVENEKVAARYEHEFREARESGRAEVHRTRTLLQTEIDAANQQVNMVRIELENEITRLRNELDNAHMETETAREKHELLLEKEADSRRDALQEAREAKQAALQDQRQRFDRHLQELHAQHTRALENAFQEKQRSEAALQEEHERALHNALEDKQRSDDYVQELRESKQAALQEQRHMFDRQMEELQAQHARVLESAVQERQRAEAALREELNRALQHALEDKERSEAHLNQRLVLSDDKIDHLQDKIIHLEEKLEVSKSAAQAAVAAAKSAKAPVAATPAAAAIHSGVPEKISPQALRETIAVLQDQLQEREGRIEELEQKIADFDTEAPAKLKERDMEIGWLRELLGVRVDDISDLINALAEADFDREAVRDAAIRIRTNLQMEQQEKERLMMGGQTFPTLASISNFASPKAVQLAAAFGNWRKGRAEAPGAPTSGYLGRKPSESGQSSRTQTPSKATSAPSPAHSFLSGLMTPPASNLRRTPQSQISSTAMAGSAHSDDELPPASGRIVRQPGAGSAIMTPRQREKQPAPLGHPRTPPLLRQASYDRDAEHSNFSANRLYDDEEGSSVLEEGADREGGERLEPFGPIMRG
ncbi:hypothetical protein BDY21DRAFT_369051 [Lineolata rhizophorae]|uniref:Uncharacterized protein n=1 Tax=Lineolata rhizophorae TaxID=578093 RepID=A0A6A6PAC9_9PEZI|nr:hypothetical protein BDY21DRAFT_369051 [Lineolata rhizophorae]